MSAYPIIHKSTSPICTLCRFRSARTTGSGTSTAPYQLDLRVSVGVCTRPRTRRKGRFQTSYIVPSYCAHTTLRRYIATEKRLRLPRPSGFCPVTPAPVTNRSVWDDRRRSIEKDRRGKVMCVVYSGGLPTAVRDDMGKSATGQRH